MLNQKQQNIVLWLKIQTQSHESGYWPVDQKTITKRAIKINEHIKRILYAWITRHPQVFQSLNSNHCLKVMFDDQTEL